MTEEDTFLRLKRIPFMEMYNLWNSSTTVFNSNSSRTDFFIQQGWTLAEWNRALREQRWVSE